MGIAISKGDTVTYAGEGVVKYISEGDWAEVKTATGLLMELPKAELTLKLPPEPELFSMHVTAGGNRFLRVFNDKTGWRWLMPGGGVGSYKYPWAEVQEQGRREKAHKEAEEKRKAATAAADAKAKKMAGYTAMTFTLPRVY